MVVMVVVVVCFAITTREVCVLQGNCRRGGRSLSHTE